MNDRYYRQIPILGEEGQRHLANKAILVIGAGGVGSPLLLYLASAGTGKLGVVDFDELELTNLHRQILFTEKDIGKNKASRGAIRLKALNAEISIKSYTEKLNLANAKPLFAKYDLIIDGSDNFQTKYLANDICCQLNLPLISVSIDRSQAQIIIIDPQKACYRCIFPEPPPPNLVQNCSISGIIGATAGIAGSMAASIAIQLITSPSQDLFSQLFKINCTDYSIDKFTFNSNSSCKSCGEKKLSWPALSYKLNLNDINVDDYYVVDIKELSEDNSAKLSAQQISLPFSELFKNPTQLPKEKILLYCSQGIRSEYAAHLLRKLGYEAYSVGTEPKTAN